MCFRIAYKFMQQNIEVTGLGTTKMPISVQIQYQNKMKKNRI